MPEVPNGLAHGNDRIDPSMWRTHFVFPFGPDVIAKMVLQIVCFHSDKAQRLSNLKSRSPVLIVDLSTLSISHSSCHVASPLLILLGQRPRTLHFHWCGAVISQQLLVGFGREKRSCMKLSERGCIVVHPIASP